MSQEQTSLVSEPKVVAVQIDQNNIASWKQGARELFQFADSAHKLGGESTFASAEALDDLPDGLDYQLWRFLRDVPDHVVNNIKFVRLTLNDYVKSLGIGLVSVRAELLDANQAPVDLPVGEESSLTIGSVLPPLPLRAQVLARFVVSSGAEELTPARGDLHGRTYGHGERMNPLQQASSLPSFGGIIHRREPVIIPKGSSIAVSVPVLDPNALTRSGLEYMEVLPQRDPHNTHAVLYVCRYRTHEAALQALTYRA